MCRKQSEQVFRYKPLGVLKRSMVTRPTCGETNTHITTTGVLHHNVTVFEPTGVTRFQVATWNVKYKQAFAKKNPNLSDLFIG